MQTAQAKTFAQQWSHEKGNGELLTRGYDGGKQQDGQGPAILIGAEHLARRREGNGCCVPHGACMGTGEFLRLLATGPPGLAALASDLPLRLLLHDGQHSPDSLC